MEHGSSGFLSVLYITWGAVDSERRTSVNASETPSVILEQWSWSARWSLTYEALVAHNVYIRCRQGPENGGILIYVKAAAWKGSRGVCVSLMCQQCAGSSLCLQFYCSGPGQRPASPPPALAFMLALFHSFHIHPFLPFLDLIWTPYCHMHVFLS